MALPIIYINDTSSLSDSDDDSQPNLNIPHGKTAQQRKRKRYRPNTDLSSFSSLINEQHTIGWDNLLRGKISKQWRQLQRQYEIKRRTERKQREVRLRLKFGKVTNPYDDDKVKKEKKKKREKDIFQALIEKFFVICQEEMWEQRNLDCHKPNNKRNYAAVIKTDREVSKLYGLKDEVCPNDRDQFYDVNLETRLAQTLSAKQQWVV